MALHCVCTFPTKKTVPGTSVKLDYGTSALGISDFELTPTEPAFADSSGSWH